MVVWEGVGVIVRVSVDVKVSVIVRVAVKVRVRVGEELGKAEMLGEGEGRCCAANVAEAVIGERREGVRVGSRREVCPT